MSSPVGNWKGRNVFITGINGFIGGNLAATLVEAGANVFGLIRNKSRESFLYFEGVDKSATLIEGELTDKELLTRVISEQGIHFVYHLAAQVEVGVARKNPYLTFETNVRGTYSLMEAVRLGGEDIKGIVIASSDKAYGSYPKSKMPYKEDYPLNPRFPYDISKACADMIARSYASELYSLPVLITRFSNIYGPGQLNFSALIPDAIRSALGYATFIPRGDGRQLRDFLFVDDVVDLYLRLGTAIAREPKNLAGEVFNAGTNHPVSVRHVLETLYKAVGNERALRKVKQRMKGKRTVGEIDFQYMDFEKAHRFCGWRPTCDLRAGLAKTIGWFRVFLRRKYKTHQTQLDRPQTTLA